MIGNRHGTPGAILTDEEIAELRRNLKDSAAYARANFHALARGKLDDRPLDQLAS